MSHFLSPPSLPTPPSPKKCERRVWLDSHDVSGTEPDDFAALLADLGTRHEHAYLSTLGGYLDISKFPPTQRFDKTLEAIENHVAIIYQGTLQADLPELDATLTGIPDFLVYTAYGYVIRACPLSQ